MQWSENIVWKIGARTKRVWAKNARKSSLRTQKLAHNKVLIWRGKEIRNRIRIQIIIKWARVKECLEIRSLKAKIFRRIN